MKFVDTHCHIHEVGADYGDEFIGEKWAKAGFTDPGQLIKNAAEAGVTRLICVGTTLPDSEKAIKLATAEANCWATIGIHPHEAKDYANDPEKLQIFGNLLGEDGKKQKIVAVGECGLDYYYNHSGKEDQEKILRFQIELALEHDLPLIFHIREAFDDFWRIFDEYKGIRGVVHSFSAGSKELNASLERNLYIGLNGIMTFTKDAEQLAAARAVPLQKLLLETDAPFLTPAPFRGTICEPKHVETVAAFLADLRGESLDDLAKTTTDNAVKLLRLE